MRGTKKILCGSECALCTGYYYTIAFKMVRLILLFCFQCVYEKRGWENGWDGRDSSGILEPNYPCNFNGMDKYLLNNHILPSEHIYIAI